MLIARAARFVHRLSLWERPAAGRVRVLEVVR
jgi:hypothetical protein